MKKEEDKASKVIASVLAKEGTELFLGYSPLKVTHNGTTFEMEIQKGEQTQKITAEALLISVGRRPHIEGIDLEKGGIKTQNGHVVIDAYGRTSQKHIFAIGDVTGGSAFTHMAENQGRAVLQTLLLPGPLKKRFDKQAVPRVTYCDPEVASVGLLEEEAQKRYGAKNIAVYEVPFNEVDRAITAKRTEGFVKVVTKKWSSKILGVTVVGPRAGEMLLEASLAMKHNIPLRKLASLIHPYPTYSLALRRAADLWLTQTVLPALRGKK